METITIDTAAPAHPFPHFWEQMFGSGRAVLSLRDTYRRDLRAVRQMTGFRYVRFHGIFDDEVGVYDEDKQGKPIYNFSYVDQIYDGLLANGVRPFVELSFMPKKLAARPDAARLLVPPERLAAQGLCQVGRHDHAASRSTWSIVTASTRSRSGTSKCGTSRTSISGRARRSSRLTSSSTTTPRATSRRSSPRLRVGGPATAQAAWVGDMIRHAAQSDVPLDFVSTHVYGNDKASDVFHTDENIPRDQMVCRAVKKVHDEIKASPQPDLPLIWSEYNASL